MFGIYTACAVAKYVSAYIVSNSFIFLFRIQCLTSRRHSRWREKHSNCVTASTSQPQMQRWWLHAKLVDELTKLDKLSWPWDTPAFKSIPEALTIGNPKVAKLKSRIVIVNHVAFSLLICHHFPKGREKKYHVDRPRLAFLLRCILAFKKKESSRPSVCSWQHHGGCWIACRPPPSSRVKVEMN